MTQGAAVPCSKCTYLEKQKLMMLNTIGKNKGKGQLVVTTSKAKAMPLTEHQPIHIPSAAPTNTINKSLEHLQILEHASITRQSNTGTVFNLPTLKTKTFENSDISFTPNHDHITESQHGREPAHRVEEGTSNIIDRTNPTTASL